MNGMINLLKPAGMTSSQAIGAMRRILNYKKIGHSGTLDPMAVGVLPICIGSGTKIVEYMELDPKKYRCEMLLGVETDTQDIWGNVINRNNTKINLLFSDAAEAAKNFSGEISQIPPKYSALKVNGKRLYEYARAGEEVEIKRRNVMIYSLDIIHVHENRVLFDVVCSKGTYVRTLCVDLANSLGYYGTMCFLVRTGTSIFSIDQAVTFEELEQHVNPASLMEGIDKPLIHFGSAELKSDEAAKRFCNGNQLLFEKNNISMLPSLSNSDELNILDFSKFLDGSGKPRLSEDEEFVKVYYNKNFLGIAKHKIKEGRLIADKVLSNYENI